MPKKSTKQKKKHCKTCQQDILQNEMSDTFRYQDTYHQLKTKDYCKNHESTYNNHKCKPHWCGDCGYLINYQIDINLN